MTEVIKLNDLEKKTLRNAWAAASGKTSPEAIQANFEYHRQPMVASDRRKLCLSYAMKIAEEGYDKAADVIENAKLFECYLLDIEPTDNETER